MTSELKIDSSESKIDSSELRSTESKCKLCDWIGPKYHFVFELCPNHRAIEFNEVQTHQCFACIVCKKYYKTSTFIHDQEMQRQLPWHCSQCEAYHLQIIRNHEADLKGLSPN